MKKPLTEDKWVKLIEQDLALLIIGAIFFGLSFCELGLFVIVTLLISFGLVVMSMADIFRLILKVSVSSELTS